MTWMQTRNGRAFDLLNPDPAMVDFAEIALTLAHINRYAGNFEKPISVAQHTLIAADAADLADRGHVLLHDAHEAFIGDIPTPVARVLMAEAAMRFGTGGGVVVKTAIDNLKARLDIAIFKAAGLAPLSPDRDARIRVADLRALQTERRDFLAKSPKPWNASVEAHAPLSKTYRLRPPMDVADELLKQFKTYLPALSKRAA